MSILVVYIIPALPDRFCFLDVALRPNAGHDLLILEVFLDHIRRTTFGRTPLDE